MTVEWMVAGNEIVNSQQVYTFERPPENIVLTDKEVHVWCALLDGPDTRKHDMLALLSKNERAKAERYHQARDVHRFIMRRGLLRKILACYLKISADQMMFATNGYGKPFLQNRIGDQSVFFNYSHSNGLVLYAFSLRYEIGIDVEHIHFFSEMDNIINRFFSWPERLEYHSLSLENHLQAFFRGWTCKEAFLKAVGKGLESDLESIQVTLDPNRKARVRAIDLDAMKAADWYLETFEPMPDYIAALSLESKGDEFVCKFWKWDEQ